MKLLAIGLYSNHPANRNLEIILRYPPEKFKTLFLLLTFLILQFKISNGHGTIKSSINYVTETKVFYLISDSINAFSITEKVNLLPEITRDSIVRLVYTNNDLKTTIYHQENNLYEAWMTKPVKTIIDKSRIKVYDRFNHLLVNELHSSMYRSNYNAIKNYLTEHSADIIPDFIQLTATLKREMLDSGFVYSNVGSGYNKFTRDSMEMIFNNAKRSNELIMYKSDGTFNYSIKKGFRMNAAGKIVPSYTIEKKWDDRFPANCVQEYKIVQYPSYTFTNYGPGKFAEEEDEEAVEDVDRINLSPNPAHNFIKVWLPESASGLKLYVYDNTGRLKLENPIIDGVTEFNVNISSFDRGIYILKLIGDTVNYSETFIKN